MARVLIAGCGYVGVALGLELAEDGHEVFGLRRSVGALPPSIVPIEADLTDPASLSAIPSDVEVVFYLASPSGFTDEAYRAAYVDGLRNVLQRVPEARRLLLVTSTGVYGQSDGEWVDETSPTEPTSFSGRRLLEAEAVAFEAAATSSLVAIAVRFGGIYGPERTRLVRSVAEGRAVIAPQPVYTNRIHRRDCAGTLRHLMSLEAAEPVYVGVDDDPAERGDVLRWLARQLDVAEPRLGDAESVRRRGGNKRCRNARLRASGYDFVYPSYREGYAEVIAAMRGGE